MAKKRKVRIDRLLILILIGLLLLILAGFGVYKLFSYFSDKVSGNNETSELIEDPLPIETKQGVKVSLLSYQIYNGDSENIGFNFIVASLQFDADGPISFDLGNLQTSEKIHLNNVSKYLNALEEKAYHISQLDIVNTVVSEENSYICNVFIPYTTDSYSLRLLNSADASMIEFDLSENINDISVLKFDTQQQIEIGSTNITVSSCSVSTMMLHNGIEYSIPATMNVYTFTIHVSSLEGDISIQEANFVPSYVDDIIPCMDETYESVKVSNCINKTLVLGDNGALFFMMMASGTPDYSGSLMLKFSDHPDWVKISTILE